MKIDRNIQFITITIAMEKRLVGVIMIILGIAFLILIARNFVPGNTKTNHSAWSVVVYGILGLLFFFAGIGLIRSTRDLTNLRCLQDLTNISSINDHGKLKDLEGSQKELVDG
jgi:hypothetical protein